MPNDEDEQTRLQMLHGVYLYLFHGELTTVPLHNPKKILDIGTGTGEWAMAMGDKYPDAEIIGTDIARIQPSAVPLNVFMEIDDAEEEGGWTWADDEFDMIHFRYMVGAFTDWKYIYTETYKHLKPGGWVEIIDFDDHKAVREFFDKDALVPKVLDNIVKAQRISGRAWSVKHLETESLTEVGFVDVRQTVYDVPMGTWPDDAEEQRIGKHFLIAQLLCAEALCMRPLVQHLGWDPEEVKRVCAIAAHNLRTLALDPERAKGLGFKMKVLIGRKPLPGEDPDGASVETITNVNGEVVNEE
jgi:SAM-dependent methyltransferase